MGKTLTGTASWFNHGPGEPGPGPADSGNSGQASGISFFQPGIAVLDQSTLRGFWHVKGMGRDFTVQQTDIGPASSTGRIVDFTWSARQAYLGGQDPTGQTFTIEFLGMSGANSPPGGMGGTAGAGGTGTTGSQAAKTGFQVGDISNPHEDYWTAINRLSQDRYWYLFSDAESLYLADGTHLMKQDPVLTLDRLDERVNHLEFVWDNTAFNYASSHKKHGKIQHKSHTAKVSSPVEATLNVICRIDEFRAGDVISLMGCGPGDGKWLIGDAKRSVFSTISELTLVPAVAPLTEDQVAGAGANTGGGATGPGGTGGATGNVAAAIAAAQKWSNTVHNYVYGGAHTGDWNSAAAAGHSGVDCSSLTSLVLHDAGMMSGFNAPIVSGEFASSWGQGGEGKDMTVWANGGHVFIHFKSANTQSNTSPGAPYYHAWGGNGAADAASGSFTAKHWPGT